MEDQATVHRLPLACGGEGVADPVKRTFGIEVDAGLGRVPEAGRMGEMLDLTLELGGVTSRNGI
jgi:hypothetical protein